MTTLKYNHKKNIKSKKAETASQIFFYVLALVVTSMILLYGYNAFNKLRSQTDKVSMLQFKTELSNTIESLSYDFGSVEIKTITAPSGFSKICFLNAEADPSTINFGTDQLIKNSLDSKSPNNVFLIGTDAFEPLQVAKITPVNDFVCIPISSGKLIVKLEAVGSSVQVSPP